ASDISTCLEFRRVLFRSSELPSCTRALYSTSEGRPYVRACRYIGIASPSRSLLSRFEAYSNAANPSSYATCSDEAGSSMDSSLKIGRARGREGVLAQGAA